MKKVGGHLTLFDLSSISDPSTRGMKMKSPLAVTVESAPISLVPYLILIRYI